MKVNQILSCWHEGVERVQAGCGFRGGFDSFMGLRGIQNTTLVFQGNATQARLYSSVSKKVRRESFCSTAQVLEKLKLLPSETEIDALVLPSRAKEPLGRRLQITEAGPLVLVSLFDNTDREVRENVLDFYLES